MPDTGPTAAAFRTVPTARPVRWGVLGAGAMARTLGGTLSVTPGATVRAVGARDAGRAADLAGLIGAPAAYGTYQEVLDDPEVDAVYVALPPDAHEPWTTAALAAGKHVLCEKPFALSAGEVDIMIAAAQISARLLVEASWYRWHPRVRLAQQILRRGDIGAVRHVSCGFTFAGVVAGNFRLDRARGGGALYDVGCYAVSAALWAAGRGLPAEVVASARYVNGADLGVDAVLSWPDCDAQIHAAMDEPGRQWLVVTGDAGEVELPGEPFTTFGDSEVWVSDGRRTDRLPVAPADAYHLMGEQVTAALHGNGWVLPLGESRDVAAVLDACHVSARTGGAPVRPS